MTPSEELKSFLEAAPLYRKCKLESSTEILQGIDFKLPPMISIPCPECDQSTNWRITTNAERRIGGSAAAEYQCANCKKSAVRYFLLTSVAGTEFEIQKVGQDPPKETMPSKELKMALGAHLQLYVKGMTCRHHSFGIGAHAYFRRLIEETTDDMLDALTEALREAKADPSAIEKVAEAKNSKWFEDKVKLASEVFPEHLRPGGHNPFKLLHSLLSRGVHSYSDDECLDVADDMIWIVEYVFKELKSQGMDRRAYAERMNTISTKLSRKENQASH